MGGDNPKPIKLLRLEEKFRVEADPDRELLSLPAELERFNPVESSADPLGELSGV